MEDDELVQQSHGITLTEEPLPTSDLLEIIIIQPIHKF